MFFDAARIIEIAVTAMGLLYLWWEFHANARMWILGIIMPAIDIYLYWNKGVYGNMLMSSYYLLVALYGLLVWKGLTGKNRQGRGDDLPITHITPRYAVIFCIATVGVWAATYYWLTTCTDSSVPALDAATNAMSIVGMWALARKFLQQWIFWIVYDVLTVYLDWTKDLPFKAAIHVVYATVAILGFIKWRNMMARA